MTRDGSVYRVSLAETDPASLNRLTDVEALRPAITPLR